MALQDVCVHTAVRYAAEESEEYVNGESDVNNDVPVQTFECVLFLPMGDEDEQAPRGGKQVRRPTLLTLAVDVDGEPVVLPAKAELGIVAAEINVTEGRDPDAEVRWQVSGSAQPLGKPGEDALGFQATLLRVEE